MRLPDLYVFGTVVKVLRQTEVANLVHQRKRRGTTRFPVWLCHDEHRSNRVDSQAVRF